MKALNRVMFSLATIIAFLVSAIATTSVNYDEYLVALEVQVCEKVCDFSKSDLSVEQKKAFEDSLKRAKWKCPIKCELGQELTNEQKIEQKALIQANVSKMSEAQKIERIDKLQGILDMIESISMD